MLPSIYRLPSVEISPLLRKGARLRVGGIELVYKATAHISKFAFIVSTKLDKRATARNRMKRLMREAVHRLMPTTQKGVDGVFLVRGKIPDSEAQVETIIRDILRKI